MATELQDHQWGKAGELVTPRSPEPLKSNPPDVRLDCQPEGGRAKVIELQCGPTPARRLAEMGILVGAVLRVQRSAPLGGPLLIEVQGSLVALGRRLAHRVLTQTLP